MAALAATCLLSCTNDTKTAGAQDTDAAQANLEAARKIANSFGTGDLTVIDSVVADNFLDHTDRGDKVGRDSLKAMIQYVRTNFSDMKMETIKEMADGDHVFQWMRYTGSSDGTKGMPAGPYDMRAIEVTRFQNGKAVEHWAYMDMAEMMKMMGQQSHTQPAGSPADTTSKAPAQ